MKATTYRVKKAKKAGAPMNAVGPFGLACPACGQAAGRACTESSGRSLHDAHRERHAAAEAAGLIIPATETTLGEWKRAAELDQAADQAEAAPARRPFESPILVACPRCHAAAGAPCKTYKGARKPACPDRVKAAQVAELEKAAAVRARCAELTASFSLAIPEEPAQLGLALGGAAGPCYAPKRQAPQATGALPLFGVEP